MSQSVNPYPIIDDRLNIHDSVHFGVLKGAQSINNQVFSAQTKTPNNITINALVPSLQTVIDRHVMLRTTFTLAFTGTVLTTGNRLIETDYSNWCLARFPFSQLVNTLSVQINNTTVNSTYQDNLNLILRQMSVEGLAKYSDLTPVSRDVYQSTASTGTLSQFRNFDTALDADNLPRGSWKIDSVDAGNTVTTGASQVRTVKITVTVTEPIFCSPFIFGDALEQGQSGLSGVSSLNFNFNLASVCNRAMRYNNIGVNTNLSCTIDSIARADLLVSFLSPKADTLIPLTCSLPYYELPIFKTTLAAQDGTASRVNSFQITSSIISPNCVPDKLYLAVRKDSGLVAVTDNDAYFPISAISITWNTQSGLLASATLQDLYYMSKQSGLSTPYLEWVGIGNAPSNGIRYLAGGMIVLDFAVFIPLMESYYAPSSLGNWTFSVNVTCQNNTVVDSIPQVELLVGFLNSGIFQTTSGSSSQYIGVLDKQTCLSTSQEAPMTVTEHTRLVGGNFLSSLKSALPTIKTVASALAPVAKNLLSKSSSNVAKGVSGALGALGYGKPRTY